MSPRSQIRNDHRGVLLTVRRSGKKARNAVAEQLWAINPRSVNATVLDDYRDWVAGGGLSDEQCSRRSCVLSYGVGAGGRHRISGWTGRPGAGQVQAVVASR
jgi:hypothetical protein